MYCHKCGTENADDAYYCAACGEQVQQLPIQQPSAPQYDTITKMMLPVGRSGLAIVAGYLGLLSATCVIGPFALLVGILALQDIKRNPDKGGKGRAIFGIVMGALGTIGLVFTCVSGILARH